MMKYLIVFVIAILSVKCSAGLYDKRYNPLHMSLTPTQLQQIEFIEDDDTISQTEIQQKVSDYLNTQNSSLVPLYNEYIANQTALLTEVKQVRTELINNSSMSDAAKNAQKQIDEISSNESLSKDTKEAQIKQIERNLSQSVLNELEQFEEGHLNSYESGYVIGKVNNGLRNYSNNRKKIFDFDFNDVYELAKRSADISSRSRRHT
uniref:DUF148 domain-containing protein n=1 Tax=Parastrongyloides trichosuri TaxID=131310 RepID=A0A0N4ZYR1_PARTI